MESVRPNSSAIAGVEYDPASQRMWITFRDGDRYVYCRVPRHVFDGLTRASSAGAYFNDHIRDKYDC